MKFIFHFYIFDHLPIPSHHFPRSTISLIFPHFIKLLHVFHSSLSSCLHRCGTTSFRTCFSCRSFPVSPLILQTISNFTVVVLARIWTQFLWEESPTLLFERFSLDFSQITFTNSNALFYKSCCFQISEVVGFVNSLIDSNLFHRHYKELIFIWELDTNFVNNLHYTIKVAI